MKTISKLRTLALATLSVAFATIPTVQSSAVSSNSAICARAESLYTTGQSTVSAHIDTMKSDFATRLLRLSSDKADVDQKVIDARNTSSTAFDAKITELKAKEGLTTNQLSAIDKYATDIKAAELTRVTAVDSARLTYRTALMNTVQTQQTDMTNAVEKYQTTLDTALTTAKVACSTASDALSTLKTTVKTAKAELSTAQKSSTKSDAIKALASTRDNAIKAANDAFKQTAKTLTATLVAVLNPSA